MLTPHHSQMTLITVHSYHTRQSDDGQSSTQYQMNFKSPLDKFRQPLCLHFHHNRTDQINRSQ